MKVLSTSDHAVACVSAHISHATWVRKKCSYNQIHQFGNYLFLKHSLHQEVAKILCEEANSKYFTFVGLKVSVASTQVCYWNEKAAMGESEKEQTWLYPSKTWFTKNLGAKVRFGLWSICQFVNTRSSLSSVIESYNEVTGNNTWRWTLNHVFNRLFWFFFKFLF